MINPSNNAVEVTREHEVIHVKGALVHATVMFAQAQIVALLVPGVVNINFQDVTACDSASLALLMALLREGSAKKTTLTFVHLPVQMRKLAKVSGVEALLPLDTGAKP